jgi:hypothetical protein
MLEAIGNLAFEGHDVSKQHLIPCAGGLKSYSTATFCSKYNRLAFLVKAIDKTEF